MGKIKLIDFLRGKQVNDIKKSGNIFKDVYGNWCYRKFDYMWNPNKKKQLKSRIPFFFYRKNAYRFPSRTPYDYNSAMTINAFGCNLKCWFCFIDDENKYGRHYIEMDVDKLRVQMTRLARLNKCNVLRVSGGEPFLQPDMPTLLEKLAGLDFWPVAVDTNLLGTHYPSKPVNNLLIVPCLKGWDRRNAIENTGADIFYKQVKKLQELVEAGHDIHLYVINNNYDSSKYRLKGFYNFLHSIHPDLPKKVEFLKIEIYEPVVERIFSSYREVPTLYRNEEEAEKNWSEVMKEETGKDYLYHLIMS
ncbi:MAG: radical SAM protein [Candidatus Helarchaeales archaeon]